MSNRVDRVVFVETSMSMVQLRNTYAQCGHILSISPWDARTDRMHLTCFVEFAEETAVKRARALQPPGTKLHIVSFSPQLSAHFLSIAEPTSIMPSPSSSMTDPRVPEVKQEPRDSPRSWALKRVTEDDIASSPESTPRKKQRRAEKSLGAKPSTSRLNDGDPRNVRAADPRTPRATAKLPFPSSVSRQPSGKENDAHAQVGQAHTTSSPKRMLPLPRKKPPGVLSTPAAMPTPRRDAPTGPRTPVPGLVAEVENKMGNTSNASGLNNPAVSSMITLTYNDRPVTCDLRKLEEDPRKIIAVLKVTASCSLERDKWMVVAAQYRVKRNFEAAIAVLEAMIAVMTSPPVSLAKTDLKPAFLMLSSCHRDLAALGGAGSDIAVHRATECLQQVYGVDIPRAQVTSEFAEARARSCMDLPGMLSSGDDPGDARAREYLADAGNLPAAPSAQEQSPSKQKANGDSMAFRQCHTVDDEHSGVIVPNHTAHGDTGPGAQRIEPEQGRSRANSQSHLRQHSERDEHGHLQILERETQALKDRASEMSTTLMNVRTAKRKLEDELVAEHAARRRAERDAVQADTQLARGRDELARAREDVARLTAELGRARRGEESALEQAAAEVESRRKAVRRAEEIEGELGRLREELGRARREAEEGKEEGRRAREVCARLGVAFARAGRGEVPLGYGLGLGLDGDGPGGAGSLRRGPCGERAPTPAHERGFVEDGRSRSVSASGRRWGPTPVIENERR